MVLAVRQEDFKNRLDQNHIQPFPMTKGLLVCDRQELVYNIKPAPIIPDLASDTGNASNPCLQIIHNGRKDLGLGLIDAEPGMRSREANFPAI